MGKIGARRRGQDGFRHYVDGKGLHAGDVLWVQDPGTMTTESHPDGPWPPLSFEWLQARYESNGRSATWHFAHGSRDVEVTDVAYWTVPPLHGYDEGTAGGLACGCPDQDAHNQAKCATTAAPKKPPLTSPHAGAANPPPASAPDSDSALQVALDELNTRLEAAAEAMDRVLALNPTPETLQRIMMPRAVANAERRASLQPALGGKWTLGYTAACAALVGQKLRD